MQVPGFIARQFYVQGSLRNTPDGFQLEAQNPMSDGTLVGIGSIVVDGQPVALDTVSALRQGDAEPIAAAALTRYAPIRVKKGDRVTLSVRGPQLGVGDHKLEVELYERDLGALRLSVTDRVTG